MPSTPTNTPSPTTNQTQNQNTKHSKNTPKMKLPPPSWPWPTCGNPKTLSFRATTGPEPPSESTPSTEQDEVENVIRGLRWGSDRLFFEPEETSSILEKVTKIPNEFKQSVVMELDSRDPVGDFKKSMEEMVEANELKGFESLQELLGWYLNANVKSNHGYIMGAFVDLLVSISFDEYDDCSTSSVITRSPTSALSFSYSGSSTSHCFLSSVEADNGEGEKILVDNASSSSEV